VEDVLARELEVEVKILVIIGAAGEASDKTQLAKLLCKTWTKRTE
jgi:hypothetical protein